MTGAGPLGGSGRRNVDVVVIWVVDDGMMMLEGAGITLNNPEFWATWPGDGRITGVPPLGGGGGGGAGPGGGAGRDHAPVGETDRTVRTMSFANAFMKSAGPSGVVDILVIIASIRLLAEESPLEAVSPTDAKHPDGAPRCDVEYIGGHHIDKDGQAPERDPGEVEVGAAATLAYGEAQIWQHINAYSCKQA